MPTCPVSQSLCEFLYTSPNPVLQKVLFVWMLFVCFPILQKVLFVCFILFLFFSKSEQVRWPFRMVRNLEQLSTKCLMKVVTFWSWRKDIPGDSVCLQWLRGWCVWSRIQTLGNKTVVYRGMMFGQFIVGPEKIFKCLN